MHKPDFVLENEMHNILLDFEIQRGQLIVVGKPEIMKNILSSGFGSSSRLFSVNKRKRKDRQILAFCQRTNKAVGRESDGDSNC